MPTTQWPIAIVGVGYTALSRRPIQAETDLVLGACRAAMADAGLDAGSIDGINLQVHHYPPPDATAIIEQLGLHDLTWVEEGGLGVRALSRAAQVVDTQRCSAVLVCKVMNTTAPVHTPAIDPVTGHVGGLAQFDVPYGLGYTMQRVGFNKQRWMHQYGITDDQVGWLCVVQRRHALLNPGAIMKQPLTLEDYRNSRWIAEPVHLLDCDYPVNGAFAYIVARPEMAGPWPPVLMVAWTGADEGSPMPHLLPDAEPGMNQWARELYTDAGLGPGDMDVWLMYDGFSFLAMQWMEELGLVPSGESGSYVEGGDRILSTGEHPVNTHGGQLSEGRMHATGHILEAVQQIRGSAGARQARRADHVIVSSAYPHDGSAAIFSR